MIGSDQVEQPLDASGIDPVAKWLGHVRASAQRAGRDIAVKVRDEPALARVPLLALQLERAFDRHAGV